MKASRAAVVRGLLLAWLGMGAAQAAAPVSPHLSNKRDAFFIENDFVYQRFLQLARDGSYRQINRERTAAEVDRGTWEQAADGTVLLHFTRGGLRFHGLLSGPLSITLHDPQTFPALPLAASAIRRWLAQSNDVVFAAESVRELPIAPLVLTVDPGAESFRREDLESIIRQMDEFVWSEDHQTCRLTLAKPSNFLTLLIPHDAVFGPGDLARVRSDYRIPPGQRPPFYFVQVDAATFARAAGSWQKLL